jgi:hypothetical protein
MRAQRRQSQAMGMDDRLMQDYETTLDAGSLIILIILLAFESAYCCSRSVWGGKWARVLSPCPEEWTL